jgi:hypothetical protein
MPNPPAPPPLSLKIRAIFPVQIRKTNQNTGWYYLKSNLNIMLFSGQSLIYIQVPVNNFFPTG